MCVGGTGGETTVRQVKRSRLVAANSLRLDREADRCALPRTLKVRLRCAHAKHRGLVCCGMLTFWGGGRTWVCVADRGAVAEVLRSQCIMSSANERQRKPRNPHRGNAAKGREKKAPGHSRCCRRCTRSTGGHRAAAKHDERTALSRHIKSRRPPPPPPPPHLLFQLWKLILDPLDVGAVILRPIWQFVEACRRRPCTLARKRHCLGHESSGTHTGQRQCRTQELGQPVRVLVPGRTAGVEAGARLHEVGADVRTFTVVC